MEQKAEKPPDKTVLVATISAVSTIAAALIGAHFLPGCGAKDTKNASSVDVTQKGTPPPAERIFRPSDPYPKVVGDLRLGMTYDEVHSLFIGSETNVQDEVSIDLKSGLFTSCFVDFTNSENPKVKSITLDFAGPSERAQIIRDAKLQIGTPKSDPIYGLIWKAKTGTTLIIGDNLELH